MEICLSVLPDSLEVVEEGYDRSSRWFFLSYLGYPRSRTKRLR